MDEPATSSPAATTVIEVTDATFMRDVVEESKRRPVVVDFWASWCAPCRTLGPILERVAEEHGGEVLLAKLDVDANPVVAGQFRIQSIPNVWAFADGRPVDQFIGSYPEPAVREFIGRLLPSEADREAAEAEEAAEAGDVEAAERGFREALEADPSNRGARLGLARLLADRGDDEEAREVLQPLVPDREAEQLLAAIRVGEWSELQDGSPLTAAKRMAADGRFREALAAMLGAVRFSPEDRDDARASMLDLFAVLGDDHPLVREYRGKLASALF
ncbi:MAG TPA: tetratricopeptide repeat protein [Actinomycetota bacterium]